LTGYFYFCAFHFIFRLCPYRLASTVYQIIIIGTTSILLSAIDLLMTIFAHPQ